MSSMWSVVLDSKSIENVTMAAKDLAKTIQNKGKNYKNNPLLEEDDDDDWF